jgi:Uma2 family endonuclease
MITLEDATLMGINAPIEHQRIISRLITGLGHQYYTQKTIALEPLPETMIDPDKTSPVPDIMLCDNENETVPVIIEITRTRTVKADLKKIRLLIDSDDYGISEGFVYDYAKNIWFKYKHGIGDISLNPSFCEAIKLDLASML